MILVKASHLRNEKLVTLIFPNHNQSTKKSPRVRKSSQLKSSSTLQVRGPAIRRRAVTTKLPSKLMRRIPREVIINPNKPNYEKQIHIKRSYILPNLVYFYNIAPLYLLSEDPQIVDLLDYKTATGIAIRNPIWPCETPQVEDIIKSLRNHPLCSKCKVSFATVNTSVNIIMCSRSIMVGNIVIFIIHQTCRFSKFYSYV